MNRDVALLRRFQDPAHSDDPAIRSLIEDLGRLDYAPAPRAEFRADLRAQLVAITERLVTEGDVTEGKAVSPTVLAPGAAGATVIALEPAANRRIFLRPVGIAAACVAVLALGFGAAVWKSQSALPGDSLYGLKLASESARLSMTSGDTDRGHEYLSLATTRVQEAQDLLGHDSALGSGSGTSAAGVSPQTVELIQTALRSADADLTSGSSLLNAQAVASHSTAPLAIMTSWAPGQLSRLTELSDSLGDGPALATALTSRALVDDALSRARTLSPEVVRGCSATATDGLGPIGCTSVPATATPSGVTSSVPAEHSDAPSSTSRTGTSHRTGTSVTSHPSGASSSPSTNTLPIPTLPTTLPSLPPVLPSRSKSAALSLGSCGITALGITIALCPSGS